MVKNQIFGSLYINAINETYFLKTKKNSDFGYDFVNVVKFWKSYARRRLHISHCLRDHFNFFRIILRTHIGHIRGQEDCVSSKRHKSPRPRGIQPDSRFIIHHEAYRAVTRSGIWEFGVAMCRTSKFARPQFHSEIRRPISDVQ